MVADEAGLQTASMLDSAGVVDNIKPVIQQEEGNFYLLVFVSIVWQSKKR